MVPYVDSVVFLKNLIRALEHVLDAESEVTEVERNHDADGWRQEMAGLTKELEDLMARGTPARTGAGGGAAGARSGGQSTRATANGDGGSTTGKRGRSSVGGASGGRASKKKKASEPAAAKTRANQSKRAKR